MCSVLRCLSHKQNKLQCQETKSCSCSEKLVFFFLPNNFPAKLNKLIFSARIRSNLSIQAKEVMCNHHNHVNRRLSVYACVSLKWRPRLRPGVSGAGSKPPSRSRRSPPAGPLVLLDRPGAEPPVVEVGFRTSSEPPSKSSRSQT